MNCNSCILKNLQYLLDKIYGIDWIYFYVSCFVLLSCPQKKNLLDGIYKIYGIS